MDTLGVAKNVLRIALRARLMCIVFLVFDLVSMVGKPYIVFKLP